MIAQDALFTWLVPCSGPEAYERCIVAASSSRCAREALRDVLREAGFRDIRVRLEILVSRLPDPMELLPGYLSVFPIAKDLAAMPEKDRTARFRRIHERLDDFSHDAGLVMPMENHVATAMR